MTTETPAPPGANRTGRPTPDVGAALRALAAREEAPAELDRLLEPLRLQDPQPPLVRPALRWAALAAAVLAAVFWLPGLAHRTAAPGPVRSAARRHHGPGHYYQLKPLPTAPPGEASETAAEAMERLEPPAPLPTPAPLEVLGPTEESPEAPAADQVPRSLVVAGVTYPLRVPPAVPAGALELRLQVARGRVVTAATAGGGTPPPGLLRALVSLHLEDVPDGTVQALLAPGRAAPPAP